MVHGWVHYLGWNLVVRNNLKSSSSSSAAEKSLGFLMGTSWLGISCTEEVGDQGSLSLKYSSSCSNSKNKSSVQKEMRQYKFITEISTWNKLDLLVLVYHDLGLQKFILRSNFQTFAFFIFTQSMHLFGTYQHQYLLSLKDFETTKYLIARILVSPDSDEIQTYIHLSVCVHAPVSGCTCIKFKTAMKDVNWMPLCYCIIIYRGCMIFILIKPYLLN